MSNAEETINYPESFSCEEMLAKAKWYHEDLQKGGWREIYNERDKAQFWIKNFPGEEVRTKVLFKYQLALSVQQFSEVSSPKKLEFRVQWDKAFFGNELLEEYPDGGGYLVCFRTKMPWPLCDREFLTFTTEAIEVKWYDKQAYLIPYMNALHKSKPANEGPYVRVTNGGQFVIATANESDPDHSCTIFGLSHNLYNGNMPSKGITWLLARAVPKAFLNFYGSMLEGHKRFFADKS
ncbi:uncharacterized protein LOC114533973 [Dendronephthya gigantea]|uniref:uncharacterized protein LOC114533973 n=1 Tax=Dendronephthya gigantea TaxID=151771 RepID=UPI00106A8523|nr:uncharacterized protein LOC114533973 [Dendronephthya gigantea]